MPEKTEKKKMISEAELKILEVLWRADGPLNAAQIRERLSKEQCWERTTVLTLIRRLLEKEAITRERREVYYYAPRLKREDYIREETRSFVERMYHGSMRNFAAALVQDKALDKQEIEELRDFFNQNFEP